MASFNRVILVGNLTRDPQMSYTPSNTAVVEFGMATNRKWKSADGQAKEDVCFVDVKAFGKSAETINQYAGKGKPMLIEGRLSFREWTDKEGKRRSKLDVVVENFRFLGGGKGKERPDEPDYPREQFPVEQPPVDEIPF